MGASPSQGCKFMLGDGATPTETFTEIGGVLSLRGLNSLSMDVIDVTACDNAVEQSIPSKLTKLAPITLSLNWSASQAQYQSLEAIQAAGTARNFRVELADMPTGGSNPTSWQGPALIMKIGDLEYSTGPNQVKCTLEIKPTAKWTKALAA